MLFYGKYENGQRYICAYDEEKHGSPRVVSDNWTYLYHNSVIVNRVCKTERDAMADSWGKYSNQPVILPDGIESPPRRKQKKRQTICRRAEKSVTRRWRRENMKRSKIYETLLY